MSTEDRQWRVWCPPQGGKRNNADLILAPDAQIAVGRWASLASTFSFSLPPKSGDPLEICVVAASELATHDPEVWLAYPETEVTYRIVKAPCYPSIETTLGQLEYEYENWDDETGSGKDKATLDVAIVALRRLTRKLDD